MKAKDDEIKNKIKISSGFYESFVEKIKDLPDFLLLDLADGYSEQNLNMAPGAIAYEIYLRGLKDES